MPASGLRDGLGLELLRATEAAASAAATCVGRGDKETGARTRTVRLVKTTHPDTAGEREMTRR